MGRLAVRDEDFRIEIVEEGMRAGQGDSLGRRWRGNGNRERQGLAVRTGFSLNPIPAGNYAGGHRRAVVPAPGAAAGGQRISGRRQSGRREKRRQHQQQQRSGGGTAHANRGIIDPNTPPLPTRMSSFRRPKGDGRISRCRLAQPDLAVQAFAVRSSARLQLAKDDIPREDAPSVPALEPRFWRVLAS